MSKIAQRWELPSVNGPIANARRKDDDEKRDEVARLDREAIVSRGYEEGLAKAKLEIEALTVQLDSRIKRLDSILSYLAKPLEALDGEVEKQLSTLALIVGKQLARRELKSDPGQIIAIIRESVMRLPAAVRDIRVHMHPDDAAIVRKKLSTPGNERAWTIVEDPALSQGGCLVRTDNSQIDARLESRLNTIVSSILGDERVSKRAVAIASESAPVEEAAPPLAATAAIEPPLATESPIEAVAPPESTPEPLK